MEVEKAWSPDDRDSGRKDTCERVDKKVQLQAQLNRTKWNRELERKKLS